MTLIRKPTDEEHLRRNPQDAQGKMRDGGGDLVEDLEYEAEHWDELTAEGEGRTESVIGDVGNAQDALLGGTGEWGRRARAEGRGPGAEDQKS